MKIRSLLLTGLLSLAALPALAATPADLDRAARESERLQRQQQLQRQEDINRNLESAHPPTHLEAPPVKTPTGHGEGCHNIKQVIIDGAPNFTDDQKKIVKTYEGHCLGVEEIQRLLGGITNWYVSKGYVTTRVYLPSQDLSTGVLHIMVIEGTVDEIRLKNGDHHSLLIQGAFPFMLGNTLNLRDFEQGLDQVNRLASNNATLDIEPGAKVGESVVVIKNDPSKRWHVNVTADNYGDKTTGRNEVSGNLGIDNFFGQNDYMSVTKRKTLPMEYDRRHADSFNGLFSAPFGYTTFTLGYSGSSYDSTLSTSGGTDLHLNGDNRSVFATIDHVIFRDQISKLILSVTMTRKTANNFAAGQKLDVSSRTLTVLDNALSYSTTLFGGFFTSQATYSKGIDFLGPLNDAQNLPSIAPHAQFDKVALNLGWVRPFHVADHNLRFSTQLTSQCSWQPLYGSEQISIGGIYTVRGFYRETMANDDGFFVRNDLTLYQPLPSVWGYDVSFNPYIALDGGAVGSHLVEGSTAGGLLGAALGFTLTAGPVSLDFYGGKPLRGPHDLIEHEGFDMFSRIMVNF